MATSECCLKWRLVLREGLTLASVVVIARAAFHAWRNRDRYDDLDGIVSFSSRIIAAWRALESEQAVGALFSDPMALALAGPRAMADARSRSQGSMCAVDSMVDGRSFRVTLVAIRTLWFDRQLQDALSADGHPMPLRLSLTISEGGVQVATRVTPLPTQVVMLGAGMDTRAWRSDLNLPEGITWFEIDREDVLTAKRTAMQRLGAAFDGDEVQSEHPLRAARYAALAVDLNGRGWSKALLAEGFDPGQPTVWVAEGLLMYLQPATVGAMLQEMAEVSAEGSVFLGLSVTEEMITRMRDRPNRSRLLSKFIYGCPADPTQMLAHVGWRLHLAETRNDMWDVYGIPPKLRPDYNKLRTSSIGSPSTLFLIATVKTGHAYALR